MENNKFMYSEQSDDVKMQLSYLYNFLINPPDLLDKSSSRVEELLVEKLQSNSFISSTFYKPISKIIILTSSEFLKHEKD